MAVEPKGLSRSALVYGRMVREGKAGASAQDEQDKLVMRIAALVPVDVISAHAFVLAATTTKNDAGETVISNPDVLRWSLIGLAVAAVALYVGGRGLKKWTLPDYVRAGLPAAAFLAWTALTGTSALTPWVQGLSTAAVSVTGMFVGLLVLAVSSLVNPPQPDAAPSRG
jgi:hypothetical protein